MFVQSCGYCWFSKYFSLQEIFFVDSIVRQFWVGGGGENCSDTRGEVTRERAAAGQKSVVLAGAECGRETWDRCHFVYGLIVKYWELRLLLSIKRYFNKNIFLIFYICTQDIYIHIIYSIHSNTRRYESSLHLWAMALLLASLWILSPACLYKHCMNENLDVVIVKKPDPS